MSHDGLTNLIQIIFSKQGPFTGCNVLTLLAPCRIDRDASATHIS